MCHKELTHIQEYSKNWTRLNPEWTIELYDDARCRDFLLQEFGPTHADLFDFIPDGPIKADFWRVCILYKYGGLYVDADIQPVVPLSHCLIEPLDFMTCVSNIFSKDVTFLNPHFIYARAGDSILYDCIQTYLEKNKNRSSYSYWNWSIVQIMKLPFKLTSKRRTYHGKTYDFMAEMYYRDEKGCFYGDELILFNSYPCYDSLNHIFGDKPILKRMKPSKFRRLMLFQ